jgi:hypothetical protein
MGRSLLSSATKKSLLALNHLDEKKEKSSLNANIHCSPNDLAEKDPMAIQLTRFRMPKRLLARRQLLKRTLLVGAERAKLLYLVHYHFEYVVFAPSFATFQPRSTLSSCRCGRLFTYILELQAMHSRRQQCFINGPTKKLFKKFHFVLYT